MKVFINTYTAHLNQFLYSLLVFKNEKKIFVEIIYDKHLKHNCVLINNNDITYFLDYSDDVKFSENHLLYNFYFKRSLLKADQTSTILPLNFQINISTNPSQLLWLLPKNKEFILKSKTEIIRLIDFFKVTNMSHHSMLYKTYIKGQQMKGNGGVIFYTRLWDPDNNKDFEEKNRRILQNEFRIEACRIIKSNFKNADVGIFDSKLAQDICPDLIFKNKIISKREYFKKLSSASICIADDGLKDTPGWKIGEYALMGKSIISTPLNVVIEDFEDQRNYLKLTNRNSFSELPANIDFLLTNNNYLQMSESNLKWSKNYLNPTSYISRILNQ